MPDNAQQAIEKKFEFPALFAVDRLTRTQLRMIDISVIDIPLVAAFFALLVTYPVFFSRAIAPSPNCR